ncbi:carbon-nitrogen hydrolase family protein [Cryomorphaceae bacterium 1068]|nr:carbon-nitrogen hydrolase family protein [Cryomorphaceae bacterium 1068]
MKVCVAQVEPRKGDIQENIKIHMTCVEMAIAENVDFIAFPELSLTGYERELAQELAMEIDDSRLDEFQNASNINHITIGVGMPLKSELGTHISMMFFQPHQARKIYSKQKLHADEIPFFVEGHEQLILTVGSTEIAPSICYESTFDEHSENAKKLGADVYLASVAKPKGDIDKAYNHYQRVAEELGLTVILSNSIGPCDNFLSAGGSAIWDSTGVLQGSIKSQSEGILIFDTIAKEAIEISIAPVD